MNPTSETYTVGAIHFEPWVRWPASLGPAPTAPQLAELYDRAAQRIAHLEAEITRLRSQILDLQS
jgi:hypothetical protein